MADRGEVVVIITKDGKMAIDIEHPDHEVCERVSARMRAAAAFLGVRLKPDGEQPTRAVPVPEMLREKGGG